MSTRQYASGQGYVVLPQAKRNRPKMVYITRAEFGEGAAKALDNQQSAAKKVAEVCRLARLHRKMTPQEVAGTARCALSHVYDLQSGNIASLDSYLPFINAVRLDAGALRRFALKEEPAPQAEQAESLLLEDAAAT